jgi:uncharacterized OB-fold protein
MSDGVPMRRCGSCGHVVFPPRPLCPSCGASSWSEAVARTGVVEEVTVRRAAGVTLASVRSDLGPVLTTRWPGGELPEGTAVELRLEPSGRITSRRIP